MARTRSIACVAAITTLAVWLGPSAHALTRVRYALLERHQTVERARAIRREEHRLEEVLRRRIATMHRVAATPFVNGAHASDVRRPATVAATSRLLVIARARLRSLDPRSQRRLRTLRSRYAAWRRWLDSQGIFRICPVPAYAEIADNFGVIVRLPHVPVHRHMGNDVAAPTGSPIVAPFDGYASTGHDKLGGLEVRVFGADGYIYNAHLSHLGQLGLVHAGDVVGYVGATGDATGPHDHIEWHPNDGPAVDPHALLVASCVEDTLTGSSPVRG